MYGQDVEHTFILAISLLGGLAISWTVVVVIDAIRERIDRRMNQLRPRRWNGVGSSFGEE